MMQTMTYIRSVAAVPGLLTVFLLCLAACQPSSPQSAQILDDTHETHVEVLELRGSPEPLRVLFGDQGAYMCRGKLESAKELFASVAQSTPYQAGFSYLDISGPDSSYRAFFKKDQIKSNQQATYYFCGMGADLSAASCMLSGTFRNGCFEAYAHGDTLEALNLAISTVQARVDSAP